jgi:OOP family OmpA-OmpF porin
MVVSSVKAEVSRCEGDRILAETLRPTVEDALRASIQKNPQVMAEALWPILGPALRHAISRAWREMIETLSEILESGLSLRGLRWRWEAFRTGRPVGEIALLHSPIYQVEQIFLIHQKTGLKLLHVADPSVDVRDSAVIAAMWTAIRDFVEDAFDASSGNTLGIIRVGEFTLWLEPGPRALLAVVIRGQPRPALRAVLQRALEQIHCDFGRELATFEGDSAPFAECRSCLEPCLEKRERPPLKPSAVWLLGTLL